MRANCLPRLACQQFWPTKARLCFGVRAHNLVVLFERKLGWLETVTIGSLRYWLFVTAESSARPRAKPPSNWPRPVKKVPGGEGSRTSCCRRFPIAMQ
jgi:hypothetical protein